MIARVFRAIVRDRRGATAVIIAMMTVPMIIAGGAAVDFSRISSARAQMQLSVDSAALAGAGAYQVNKDGVAAYNVANTTFKDSTTNLTVYTALSSTVGTLCNPSGAANVTCGTTSGSSGTTSNCPSTTVYCVQVTAHAVLQNSLLAIVIPNDVLNVTSTAQSTGTNSVGSGNFTHSSIGYGSDLSAIYAYAVPTDTAGHAIYNSIPAANSNCASSVFGPIQFQASTTATAATTCNYVLIGENSGSSGTGSISLPTDDPIGFTFVNFSGGTITSGYGDLDANTVNASTGANTNNYSPTPYYNELYITFAGTTYYEPNGATAVGIPLFAYCPAHNLYGSINAYPNTNNDIVPYQDSINTYASAYEMLGYPPTHATNHLLLPFLGPVNTIAGLTGVTIQAVCPQWPPTNTKIANATATGSNPVVTTMVFSPHALPTGYSPVTNAGSGYPAETVPVYATYYPDKPYSSGTGVFPPVVGGCTPATSATDGGVTPAADDPWWGFSPPNNTQYDPGGAGENPGGGAVTNCTTTRLNSPYTSITSTLNATQTSIYNDCAFIIQPLGTGAVPNLPDYYQYLVSPGAFATQATGNVSSIVPASPVPPNGVILPYNTTSATGSTTFWGMTPQYDGVTNSHPAGFFPGSNFIVGTSSPYLVSEPPTRGIDAYPPEDTSHQCYNPQANGFASTDLPGVDQPNNDNNTTIDPVANPEFGAVFCNVLPVPNFVLFWNDMGAYNAPPRYNDDLNYGNAITEFTCPTPGSPGASGPPTLVN